MGNQIIVIPSYHPDERLLTLADELCAHFAPERILIVDDGSGPKDAHFFDACREKGVRVLTHEINRGKGRALKTAVEDVREHFGADCGIITADADGQHLVKDIVRVAEDMDAHPDALVLGSRDFGKGTPWKSLFGNRLTSFFFFVTTGRKCRDTQTGLRGIPASLMPLAAVTEGERYEYEMNFLMDAALVAPFHTTVIETVYYDDNKGSHFHPVRDAVRVYGRFIRFFLSSCAGFVVDILMFMLFMKILPDTFAFLPATLAAHGTDPVAGQAVFAGTAAKIVVSTVLARLCSGIVNFLLNKYYSFKSRKRAAGEALRYFVLFICLMAASALLTAALSRLTQMPTPTKIVVDVVLFLASYRIQRAWVFRQAPPA
ncbi:MAG: glycosyltransferase [Lachnospiraceae bacterium]|nr:glycosyltransferase [Lachnospiraceae bacterium]